jgi:DNA-binding CsgD family transcriptional regulator/tetratricopeptide (TPR) repeat protein
MRESPAICGAFSFSDPGRPGSGRPIRAGGVADRVARHDDRAVATQPLLGRESEVGVLDRLVDGAHAAGGALVVRGEPGIGKSALLEAAAGRAGGRGMLVLRANGVPSEAHLPFAGLHQLLQPLLADLHRLPPPQRTALEAAFGMAETAAPDLFLIALATLDLLGDVSERAPVLVIAEDAHWLDRSTAEALAFVARRVRMEPILVLAAVRDGSGSAFDAAGLDELRVTPLDAASSSRLLDAHAPELAVAVRARLLEEAAGNPLALIELPVGLGLGGWTGAALPGRLPLSARLESAFAARLRELPRAAQTVLLVAAADGGASLAEVLGASAIVEGAAVGVDVLGPAVSARLAEVDSTRIRFRHPLVSTAVYQAASVPERQAVHAALAEVLSGDPDRGAWHRAAAAIGEDEGVAVDLEAVAENARRRGAIASAVAALERAAELSGKPQLTAGRLLRAAELAVELGRLDVVARLVREAEPLAAAPLDRGRLAWIRVMCDPGPPGEPARMRSLIETGSHVGAAGDTSLALRLLWAAATSGFWADRENELSAEIVALAEGLAVRDDDPWLLAVLAYAAPIDRGGVVVERVSRLTPDPAHPDLMWLLSAAAATVGAFDLAGGFASASVAGLREQGRLGALAQALVLRAWSEIHVGRWDVALPDAEEADRLAKETGQPIWRGGAQVALSILAGLRGDEEEAEAMAARAERVGLQFGARAVLSVVQLARGLTALGAGRHDDAYAQLRRMFSASDPAYHRMESCWAIGNLAEAAVHSGHGDAARAVMGEMERLTVRTPSPWLHVAMRHARALLAEDADAEPFFQAGLEADLRRWPFDRARLFLAYGAWLRRQRRVAESRVPLRAARDGFDALGVVSWGERARQELRASGETSRARTVEARDQLTPQELQIARMAAEGLTNREIGQRLYLSHRTVGAHLRRIFPKLAVASRRQLPAALAGEGTSRA